MSLDRAYFKDRIMVKTCNFKSVEHGISIED